jgi:hypothetical protein
MPRNAKTSKDQWTPSTLSGRIQALEKRLSQITTPIRVAPGGKLSWDQHLPSLYSHTLQSPSSQNGRRDCATQGKRMQRREHSFPKWYT